LTKVQENTFLVFMYIIYIPAQEDLKNNFKSIDLLTMLSSRPTPTAIFYCESTADTFSCCESTADTFSCCESTADTFSCCESTADTFSCCESTADTFSCCKSTLLLYHDVILASTMKIISLFYFYVAQPAAHYSLAYQPTERFWD
jgi:hypothetical protein